MMEYLAANWPAMVLGGFITLVMLACIGCWSESQKTQSDTRSDRHDPIAKTDCRYCR